MSVVLLLLVVGGVFGGITLLGGLAIYALVVGTKEKGKWGVNLTPPTACPACAAPLPMTRIPKNLRQALWGGWTCSGCGKELDKWGRVVGA